MVCVLHVSVAPGLQVVSSQTRGRSSIIQGSILTVATGKPESESRPSLNRHIGWVVSLAFAPNGKFIASDSGDKTISLRSAAMW